MTAVLLTLLFALLGLGVPIFMTLVIPSAVAITESGIDPMVIVQRMVAGIDKFSIMAVPFFMYCADIMSAGKIGKRLVNFSKAFIGHLPGGLAIATIVACMIFGAISGAGTAAVVAVGGLTFSLMRAGKYDESYASGLILTSSTLAMLIPPSIAYVLYSNITGDSIQILLMSGLQAGVIFGLALCVFSFAYAKIKKLPLLPKASWKERTVALKEALLSLGMIVIILGGIYGGLFTATEAAAVACVYAIFVEVVIYRSIGLKKLFELSVRSAQTIAMLMILIAAGSAISWVMTVMQIPQQLVALLDEATPIVVLLVINMLFLIAGMFVDPNSAIIVLTPLVFPVAKSTGIDSIHLATTIVVNLSIGMLTPPFGLNIFVGTSVFKKNYGEIVRGIMPFIAISLVLLVFFMLIPGMSTALPSWLLGYRPR